jgi:(2Fe-2S) ferredoxin
MKNVQELNQLKQAALEEMDSKKWKILICGGTGCTSSGSIKLLNKLEEELEAAGIREDVNIIKTGCFGLCALGPIMIVYPDGYFYSRLEPEQLHEIVQEHLAGGRPVLKYLYEEM